MKPLLFFAIASALLVEEAVSQDITERLVACQSLLGDAERLACFEAIAESTAADEAQNEQILSEAQSDTAPKSNSVERVDNAVQNRAEMPETKPGLDNRPIDMVETRRRRTSISAAVARAWEDPFGKLMIELDNGEVWKQTTRGSRRAPDVGDLATARRSAFGAWFFKFGDSNRETRMALVSD